MQILFNLALVAHIIGFAAMFGVWFSQLKPMIQGTATVMPGMLHSGYMAGGAGIVLVALSEVMYHPSLQFQLWAAVKLLVLAVILVLGSIYRKRSTVPPAVMWSLGALMVLNISVAVLWQTH